MMHKFAIALVALAVVAVFQPALAAGPDLGPYKAAFEMARQVSEQDGGRLWGKPLYGPLMFVDAGGKIIVANEPDAEGALQAQDGLYVGALPPEMLVANTDVQWHGKHWTMLEWPVWGDVLARKRLLAHEMYHRIQADVGLRVRDTQNQQLDTLDGRLWLQLEWRALAVALASDGKTRLAALRDALAFRSFRHGLFAGSAESERAMELNEGLAEYTGVRLGSPDDASARWVVVQKLAAPSEKTWVRSFPYITGPAYGLLLDVYAPGWRSKVRSTSDMADMLAAALPKGSAVDAKARAAIYGEAALRVTETERSREAEAAKARYRAALIEGPVLLLPRVSDKFNVSFNPNELVPLGEAGSVYPTMQVSDAWGKLVAKEGVLMPANFSCATVVAPANPAGAHVTGPGWTLDLAPGWHVVPGEKSGSFTVKKD